MEERKIQIAINEKKRQVVLDFGQTKPVFWVGLPPNEAIRIGELLILGAQKIKETTKKELPPQ